MRKPDQYGRSLVSAMPLAMAAEACSRIPKCRFRPGRSSGWKSPAPSKMSLVLVEGDRSAEPPTSHGTAWATALSTCPDESRLAMPLASAREAGQRRLPARRAARAAACARPRRPVRGRPGGSRRTSPPMPRGPPGPGRRCPRRTGRRPRRGRRSPRPRACRGTAWSPGLRRPRTAHRAPWASPRPASRSRCGCARGPGSAARLGQEGASARPTEPRSLASATVVTFHP